MSLKSDKTGRKVTLACDVCGMPARSLRRITGHWLNPRTGRKVTSGVAWACPDCVMRIREGGDSR